MRKRKTVLVILLTVVMVLLECVEGAPKSVYAKQLQQTGHTDNMQMIDSNVKIKGSNSVGVMVANSLSSKQEEQTKNNGCNIFSATVTKKCVSVSFETVLDGTLVAAIYDEDGIKM